MSHSKSNINLEQNGRIFPSWVMQNFKKYILPEILRKEGEDPCKKRDDVGMQELQLYQKFISAYMDYRSPYHDILIYHGVGSGKTASTINIYNMLYNYTPGWNVFILLKAIYLLLKILRLFLFLITNTTYCIFDNFQHLF